MIDEKARERIAAAKAICAAMGDDWEREGPGDVLLEAYGPLADAAIQALRPGSTGETELHGPFGYLVCPIGLDESHWRFENDPEKDAAYVCLPVFTKEDPFERALLAAGEGRDE